MNKALLGPVRRPAGLGRGYAHSTTEKETSEVALTPNDVADLARLARIQLTEDELSQLAPQLDVILQSVAHVADVAAENIPPTSHALPLTNVFREDVVRPSLPLADVLAGAPAAELDRFRVPRILGEDA
jgi:aspartyl-tRNA(Asn)/glutamyl-tRNA(Gln) amidotransferase subunit C